MANKVDVNAAIDIDVTRASLKKIDSFFRQSVRGFASGDFSKAVDKDLAKASKHVEGFASDIDKALNATTGKFKKNKDGSRGQAKTFRDDATLGRILGAAGLDGDLSKQFKGATKAQLRQIKDVGLPFLRKGITDLQTNILNDSVLAKRGQEVFGKLIGNPSAQEFKKLNTKENRAAVAEYSKSVKARAKLLRGVESGLANAFGEFGGTGSDRFRSVGLERLRSSLEERARIGEDFVKGSVGQVRKLKQLEEERHKLAQLESKRLDARKGRDLLRAAGGDVSGVPRSQVGFVRDHINRERERLSRRVNTLDVLGTDQRLSTARQARARALADGLRNQLGELDIVSRQVTTRLGGFRTAAAQAGATLRQFFKYAIGYGVLYQVLGAVNALVRGLVGLDESLISIRAIAGASSDQMVGLEASIKRVATTTKFTLDEVAKAAQVLSQAGVSASEIPSALEAVAQFASGTNTALETSADVISTVRNVFKEITDRKIADLLTKSVNISKLTGEDLKVILSRGAQVAKAYNITAEQFLGASAILKNAGIRASTVSTGLRQGVLELLSPDAKTIKVLKQRYAEVGESLSESDIKDKFFGFQSDDNPLTSVLRELKRLGATGSGAKAFERIFDVRAQNVIKVLIDELDQLDDSLGRLSVTGSASLAAEIQMRSLSNSMKNLGAVTLSLADTLSGDLVESLAKGTRSFTEFLDTVDKGLIDLQAKGDSSSSFSTGLLAGITGFSGTKGGLGKRTAVGVASGLGAVGTLNILKGTGNDGIAKTLETIASVAAIAFGLVKAVKGFKASKKLFGKASAANISRIAVLGRVLSGFSLGPVIGTLLAVFSAGSILFDTFGGKDTKDQAEALKKQAERASTEANRLQEIIDDADVNSSGSSASKLRGLRETVQSFPEQLQDILGVTANETIQDLVVRLGTSASDIGSSSYKNVLAQLQVAIQDAGGQAREFTAQERDRLQSLGAAYKSASSQSLALARELEKTYINLVDLDPEDPANKERLESIRAAVQNLNDGIYETPLQAIEFISQVLRNGNQAAQANLQKQIDLRNKAISDGLRVEVEGASGSPQSLQDLARTKVSSSLQASDGRANLTQLLNLLESQESPNTDAVAIVKDGLERLDESIEKASLKRIRAFGDALDLVLEKSTTDADVRRQVENLFGPGADRADIIRQSLGEGLVQDKKVIKLSEQGQRLSTLAENLTKQSAESDLSFKDRVSTKEQIQIIGLNRQIADSKRGTSSEDNSVELLKQRQKIEADLLKAERQNLESQKDKVKGSEFTKKIAELDRKSVELKDKQQEELRKAVEDRHIKRLSEAREELNLQLRELKLQGEDTLLGTEEYNKNQQEQLAVNQTLAALQIQEAAIRGKSLEVAEKKFQIESDELNAAAEKKAREDLNTFFRNKVEDSDLNTQAEQDQINRSGGLSESLRAEQLTRQIQSRRDSLDQLQSNPIKTAEDDKQIKELTLDIQNLRHELDGLTKGVVGQVFDGFNPDTVLTKLEQIGNTVSNLGDKISDKLAGAIDSIGDKFVDAIAKGENFFDSLRSIVTNTLLDITRQIIKAQINGVFGGFLEKAGIPGFGSASASAAQTVVSSAAASQSTASDSTGQSQQVQATRDLGGIFASGMRQLLGAVTGLGPIFTAAISGIGSLLGIGGAASGGLDIKSLLGFTGVAQLAPKTGVAQLASLFGFSPFSQGGLVKGPGTSTSDSIPAMLSNGEAVLNAKAVKALGPDFINKINRQAIRGFAQGGVVSMANKTVTSPVDSLTNSLDNQSNQSQGNGTKVVNVLDPSLVSDYLSSSQGEEVVLNILRRNPNAVQ